MKSWVVAYSPLKRADIVGHEKELDMIANYLAGKTKKPILLGGPTGGGKTAMIVALATERDFEVIEVNASDTRNKGAIEQVVGNALKQQSLFMRKRLVLVDEVDSVSGRSDRGAIPSLVKLIKETSTPMIFTANDAMSDKLKPLRKECMFIQLTPLAHEHVVKHLSRVNKQENAGLSTETISAIGRRSGGDLRAAVNDLQTVASTGEDNLDILGERDVTGDIADALLRVFKTTQASVALPAYDNVPEDLDKIFMWLDENLPKEYTKPEDIARAYEAMSRADIFFGRIRRWQYYRYYVYCYNLLSAGVALAKDEKYKGMPNFVRSERPLKIWIANMANVKKKAIAEKVAEGTHTSTRRVLQEFSFYLRACRNKKFLESFADEFDLNADEVSWLKQKA